MSNWLNLITDWFQTKAKAEEKTLKTFERLWSGQEDGQRITFVSVVIQPSATSSCVIEDIGLSVWSKHILSENMSYHWHVQENFEIQTEDVVTFGNPDSFAFGKTQTITADDIKTVLDDWILSLSGQCDQLCLVIFGRESAKKLEKQWTSPSPVVLLDLEVLWRLRYGGQPHATFDEAASELGSFERATAMLDDAGNQAYYLLSVLRQLGGAEGPRGDFFPKLMDVE
ncbi:hypothetical protein PFICI_07691 [Pestalotiopsis fici W106-1]|uniref:Gfd2/YDR514C-like C-terminal domain-containing protein n=1 Tax=Pestalotiopsis fici (strain W106-1 / CGMCC3.15140) TaxID=1229662 RepID=W3X435_PESFW|nr:uncharacterized protein PFICI_07691 [Pestalotiopsis fici W106-1]ETS80162.1 hypothetical protein PFICI_07691 [Pestalotiopsis fici W106-1]